MTSTFQPGAQAMRGWFRNPARVLSLGALTLPFGKEVTLVVILASACIGGWFWMKHYQSLRYDRNAVSVLRLMLFASIVATLAHGDHRILGEDVKRLLVIAGLFHLGLGLRREDTRRMYLVLSWASFFAAMVAVVQLGSFSFLSLRYKTELQQVLAPNELGGLAAMALLGICVSTCRQRRDLWHALPAGVALLLSASRTAISLLVIVLVGAVVVERLPRAFSQIWMGTRVILVAALLVAVSSGYSQLANGSNENALRGRSTIWHAAIVTVRESFPIGLGSTEAANLSKRSSVSVGYLADAPGRFHSAYLDLIVQYGVAGLGLAMWTLYALVWRSPGQMLIRDRSVFLCVVVFGGARALFESGGWLLSDQASLATALSWVLLGAVAIRSSLPFVNQENRIASVGTVQQKPLVGP